jgi:hypothetical protein
MSLGKNECFFSFIEMDEFGNFIIVWMDNREGKWDIYGQKYDKLCSPVGENFKVNPEENDGEQYNPSVAINEWGEFIVVWSGFKGKNLDIFCQIYNPDCTPQEATFLINDDMFYRDNHQWSWKSVITNGELLTFTWLDNRRLKGWDIYAKLMRWKREKRLPTFSSLSIYPNPCAHFLNIKSITPLPSDIEIIFYDICGNKRKVKKECQSKYLLKLDVRSLNSGVYFVKVKKDNYLFCEKVIILKK